MGQVALPLKMEINNISQGVADHAIMLKLLSPMEIQDKEVEIILQQLKGSIK